MGYPSRGVEGYAPEAREIGVGSWELGKLATKGTKGAWERSLVMPKAVRAKPGWLIREDRQTKGTRRQKGKWMRDEPSSWERARKIPSRECGRTRRAAPLAGGGSAVNDEG